MTEAASFLSAHMACLDRPTADRIAGDLGGGAACVHRGDSTVLSIRSAAGTLVACHSRYDPTHEACQWLPASVAGPAPTLFIVVGASCGYLLDAIERQAPSARVIALEPEPGTVRWLLERRDWQAWLRPGRLRLLVGPDYEGVASAWQLIDLDAPDPVVIVHPVLARARPDDVAQCEALAQRIVFDARANAKAREQLGGVYLEHTLRNVGTIAREADAGALTNRFAGIPAVLVAAGPSLDGSLDALSRLGSGALLIAVDTACHPLLAAGIPPDLVVAVDPSMENAAHLNGLPGAADSWLVAEGSVEPSCFEPFARRTFTFNVGNHHPWPWLHSLGIERATLKVWGSVLTTAFDLALKAGCDPIVFVGADLGYTGGQPYCRETAFEQVWAQQMSSGVRLSEVWRRQIALTDPLEMRDLNGAPVLVSRHLLAFRDWIVERARAHPGRRIVNATGAGMLFGDQIEQAALRDLVDTTLSTPGDVRDTLEAAHAASISTARATRDTAALQCDIAAVSTCLPDWMAFSGGQIDAERIADALRHSRNVLSPVRPRHASHVMSHDDAQPVSARRASDWFVAINWPAGIAPHPILISRDDLLDVTSLCEPFDSLDLVSFVELPLAVEQIRHEAGFCYQFLFRTAAGRLFSFDQTYARLPLFEDGQPLASGGAQHDEIRRIGGGRYSLWPHAIYFSSSDGSDPRTNGRTYHTLVRKHLHFLEHMPQTLIDRFGL